MQISKHFNRSEFDSKDGAKMPSDVLANIINLVGNLEAIRSHLNTPLQVNSGYRSESHNKAAGGVKNSQHTKGTACDFVPKGYDLELAYSAIIDLMEKGFITKGGLGLYNTFIHYDIRGKITLWDYRK